MSFFSAVTPYFNKERGRPRSPRAPAAPSSLFLVMMIVCFNVLSKNQKQTEVSGQNAEQYGRSSTCGSGWLYNKLLRLHLLPECDQTAERGQLSLSEM